MIKRATIPELLNFIDLFGSPFNLYVYNNRHEYNTKLGGFYTIIVFLSSLVFGIIRFL
jgi:hypothetical protein